MTRLKLFIDFDDTLVNSSETIINLLNKKYGTSHDISQLQDWQYKSIIKEVSSIEIQDLFESEEFWTLLMFKTGIAELLSQLHTDFDICIVSKGTDNNLRCKKKWIDSYFPFAVEFIESSFHNGLSKELIDMKNGIQIDDVMESLIGTNAAIKVLFQDYKNFYWNQPESNQDNLYVCQTWEDITTLLYFLKEYPEFCQQCYTAEGI